MAKKQTAKKSARTEPSYKTFFRSWRIYRKLTQEELADRMGTNKVRVNVKERDLESWDQGYLDALSRALEVDTWSLLYRDPTKLSESEEGQAWQIFDSLPADDQAKTMDYMRTLKLAKRAQHKPD